MLSDLKNITAFVEVATRLSFTDAARTFGVPLSTVSTRINSLESQLGVRLLNRSTRKVAITPAGRDFLGHCQRAIQEIESGREKLLAVQETQGLVRISLPSAFPKAEFAAHVAEFRKDYPKITIDAVFDDALADFINEDVDLALRGRAPGADGLYARRLANAPVIFVVPSKIAQFDGLPTLQPLRAKDLGTEANHGVATQSLEFALELVKVGQACAYLPLPVCQMALTSGDIRAESGPLGPQDALEVFLIYHEKRYQPRRVTLFKDFLIDRMSA